MAKKSPQTVFHRTSGEKAVAALIHLVMILFCTVCLVPVILSFIVSISSEQSVIRYGYRFIPNAWSLEAYRTLLANPSIIRAYMVTICVTLGGTLLSLAICSLAGYGLSVKKVKFRDSIAIFFYIPMVFSAGLVPWYVVCTKLLGFKNSYLALIMPGLVSTFNIFLLRNYFRTIPESLIESAQIDGAGALYTFVRIVLPLATPIMATVSLFTALDYWNNWSNTLWFIDQRDMFTLQYYLYRIKNTIGQMSTYGTATGVSIPTQTTQIATLFVTIGPIILIYPFVQRYFVKGIMIGAVKG